MAASTASWTMLFGFVAIVLPPAPSWSRRYVPAHLLKKRQPCLYYSSACPSASSACGSRPTLSTAGAMFRAMAMTALIDKLTSRPFVFFGMFHPSPRERPRQRLTRCGTRLLAAAVPERSRQSRGLGQRPERPRRPPYGSLGRRGSAPRCAARLAVACLRSDWVARPAQRPNDPVAASRGSELTRYLRLRVRATATSWRCRLGAARPRPSHRSTSHAP